MLIRLKYGADGQEKINEINPVRPGPRGKMSLSRPSILVVKSARTLTLYDGPSQFRSYPVAIGKPSTPTPSGNFAIATKIMNPGGILGTRWLGLTLPNYGIHGTPFPWTIGQMASLGCIRMHNSDVLELSRLVPIGTPVTITD